MKVVTDEPDVDPGPTHWLASVPLRLRDEVEFVTGANDAPMLFHRGAGTYIRLTPTSARILRRLDGTITGSDLIEQLSHRSDSRSSEVREAVKRLLEDLRKAGVLNVPPEPLRGLPKFIDFMTRRAFLRLRLARSLSWLTRPVVDAVSPVPAAILTTVVAVVLLLAVYVTIRTGMSRAWPLSGVIWPAVVAAMVLHLSLHELSHALVCEYLGVPIREVGVGLLYGFLPVAYVDRTDAYRLRSKGGRVAIALAGPGCDMMLAGVSAFISLTSRGRLSDTALMMMLMQVMLMVNNLNPILPTDGYHALEAAVGEMNLRQRASRYLLHWLSREPMPSSLAHVSRLIGTFYVAYGLIVVLYVALIAAGLSMSAGALISSLGGR